LIDIFCISSKFFRRTVQTGGVFKVSNENGVTDFFEKDSEEVPDHLRVWDNAERIEASKTCIPGSGFSAIRGFGKERRPAEVHRASLFLQANSDYHGLVIE